MPRRKKLSTTISPEGYAFLRSLIRAGKAENLAQAIDHVLGEFRRLDNRRRLARATAQQYEQASQAAMDEENNLAAAFDAIANEINPDE
jgi:hypothetical protein